MLTHVDAEGRPGMVDVTDKSETAREAVAEAKIWLPQEVSVVFRNGDIQTKKGSVLHTAIIAGTMAVKKTSDLIPFCHPIPLESIRIEPMLETLADGASLLSLRCTVKNFAKTGIEMEALTGATIAALTVYDMCKALTHKMEIRDVKLLYKSGGKTLVDQR